MGGIDRIGCAHPNAAAGVLCTIKQKKMLNSFFEPFYCYVRHVVAVYVK